MADLVGEYYPCRECGDTNCRFYNWFAKRCVKYLDD